MNTLSAKGATFMRLHEGFVARWYLDPVGVPTIGIGFTWRSAAFRKWWAANKPGVKFARGVTMTREEAEDALRYLVDNEYGKAVNEFLKKKVNQHVYDGMVSPVFNLGPGSLKWTWAAAVKRNDIKDAARRLTKTGVTARGVRLPGLVRRRKEEAALLRDGVYTGVDTPHGHIGRPAAMTDGILERGERGVEVAQLINDLHKLGFYDGVRDDVFGHGTEAAVLNFQREHGIDVDGKAGPQTLKAISDALKGNENEPPTPVKDSEHWFWKILKRKLIPNWQSCMKWFSVQTMVLAGAIQTTWVNIPDDFKAAVPESWISTATIALMVLGIIGRVLKQGGDG